ncbi:MAG: hypothetical protein ABL985_05680 [Casimicrobium sp.]
MSAAIKAVNNIEILLAVVSLIWFLYGPWSKFVLDAARQYLFELRDQVFDMAKDGKIPFDSAGYRLYRDFMNMRIRVLDAMTLNGFTLTPAPMGKAVSPLKEALRDSCALDVALEIELNYLRSATVVMCVMVLRAPVVLFSIMVFLPFISVVKLAGGPKATEKFMRRFSPQVEREQAENFSLVTVAR